MAAVEFMDDFALASTGAVMAPPSNCGCTCGCACSCSCDCSGPLVSSWIVSVGVTGTASGLTRSSIFSTYDAVASYPEA